jgi:hypothetical protein
MNRAMIYLNRILAFVGLVLIIMYVIDEEYMDAVWILICLCLYGFGSTLRYRTLKNGWEIYSIDIKSKLKDSSIVKYKRRRQDK